MSPELAAFEEVARRSAESASDIDTSRQGQTIVATGNAVAMGSLAYYAGETTSYFTGEGEPAIPLVLAFLSLSGLAAHELANICGRRNLKTLAGGLLSGGTAGAGLGLGIAGIAFGLTADLVLTGGLGALGLLVGGLIVKRGRKRHNCGARLPCDTWICPRCGHIISPSKDWSRKDLWNILDVCDYLDTGGRGWNTVTALAFLEYCGLTRTESVDPFDSRLWQPSEIKSPALDQIRVLNFQREWSKFRKDADADESYLDAERIGRLLRSWAEDRSRK